ncbi:hypothetical protein [Acinetobacter johnsonii]|uniref:hypothetical protein n=1 Tax=Acinetobacter johnsonii TaxID=40214 RepID=UPI0019198115|nr:hypothetical protein [Acinetobacter johnsonii]QQT94626.1 hypothetical protein I6I51_08060 [Acinetobacter johnsonii]
MNQLKEKDLKQLMQQLERPITAVERESQQRQQQVRMPKVDKFHEPFNKHRYSGW